MDDRERAEQFINKWFEKKPNTKIIKSYLMDSILLKIPNKSYAEIYAYTRFDGKNILPESKIECWNNFWVCAGLPVLETKHPEENEDAAEVDFNEETGLARLVAVRAKKLLIAVAQKHNLFALYNENSDDLGTSEDEKSRDAYTLNLAVLHPIKEKDLQKLYDGVHEFATAYAIVRKIALEQRSELFTKIDKTINNILTPK